MKYNNTRRNNRGGKPSNNSHSNGNNGKKTSRTRVYDSNGPDVRIRGTAWQVTEKYQALAKDAEASGNWVMAEGYYQHAEHYQRIINSFEDEKPAQNSHNNAQDTSDDDMTMQAHVTQETQSQETVAA